MCACACVCTINLLPIDSHFLDGHLVLLSNVEQLHIEGPAIDVHYLEESSSSRPSEELESTLCVLDLFDTQDVDQHVEAIHQYITD